MNKDMRATLLEAKDLVVRLSGQTIIDNISFTAEEGECLAIQGPTGSGKTILAKALAGRIMHTGHLRFADKHGRSPRVAFISRRYDFSNLSNIRSFYYQQRFNASDAEDARTLTEELLSTGATEVSVMQALETVGIMASADKRLIMLSTGEQKRFQLAKAILQDADWLILDNPYAGLDASARKNLGRILDGLVHSGKHIILFSGSGELPSVVTRVLLLREGRITQGLDRESYEKQRHALRQRTPEGNTLKGYPDIPAAFSYPDFRYAVRMKQVSVSYGGRKILNGIDWEIRKGECWSLSGPNGSGKSTLLSLICGDNPQAFANDILLFDRKKGSGESIWDIKRNIGQVSPEMHQHFGAEAKCLHIVASGLFDTIGLFRRPDVSQISITEYWMERMGIAHLAGRQFHTLSDGEQRQVLLTRALVKDPPMLILDEPCQGLDEDATAHFNALVDAVTRGSGKTLIYVSHYEQEIPGCVTKRMVLGTGPQGSVH